MSVLAFSDTTTKLGIIQACESYTNLGDTGISGDSTLLKEFTRWINKTQSQIWFWIFDAYGGWQWDDANQSNLPSAADTLTSGTSIYGLPTGAITVRGVEVMTTGSVWNELQPITAEQIRQLGAVGQFQTTTGQPAYYQLIGDTIKIYPTPNYTQSSSFKVFFDRGSVAFASTDTSKIPGFISEFHDAVPVGASLGWLSVHKPNSTVISVLTSEWARYEQNIKRFYTQRFAQMFPPRFTVVDAVREFI